MAFSQPEASEVTFEDLALLEEEFDDVDLEILRKQYALTTPLYTKRAAAVLKIPNFWALVLEQAPPEIDSYIQPQDSRIFAESLVSIDVRRPELDANGENGNPRSVSITLEFSENEHFENKVLEKTFHHRRSKDGWVGLVSEPVKIRWKKGKDLTQGLTDGAAALFEARKKKGDMTSSEVPEYQDLKKKVDSWNGQNTSFFTWFGWVSGRRYVTREESEGATAKYVEERSKRQAGEQRPPPTEAEMEEEIENADDHDEDVEVHQHGEELAIAFAEDLWPNAIKLFTEGQEEDEFEEDGMDELDEDSEDAEGGDDGPVDIRSLVQPKGEKEKGGKRSASGSGPPPGKKQKR